MNWTKAIVYFLIVSALLLSDAALKAYIHYWISPLHLSSASYPFGGIAVFRDWHGIDFSIVHVANKGAAWGVFASFQQYLLYFRILIIGGLLSYLIFVKTSTFRKIGMLLIAAGAIGNVLDTFIYGHVVDMFYFIFWGYSYPVFNIADAAIFCGIALLLIESLAAKLKSKKPEKKNVRGTA
jgi:signal peptidase II